MTARTEPDSPQRRRQSRELIDHMLAEREAMLMLLWKVSGRVEHDHSDTDIATYSEFISVLVDYIAAGHFGLYQRLADGTERREPVNAVAARVYPRIAQISDAALDFNDRFGEDPGSAEPATLNGAVEALAELLVERIGLEDCLIEAMLGQAPDTRLPPQA